MHRNARFDDVFDVLLEIVDRLDPPPTTLIPSIQLVVGTSFDHHRCPRSSYPPREEGND